MKPATRFFSFSEGLGQTKIIAESVRRGFQQDERGHPFVDAECRRVDCPVPFPTLEPRFKIIGAPAQCTEIYIPVFLLDAAKSHFPRIFKSSAVIQQSNDTPNTTREEFRWFITHNSYGKIPCQELYETGFFLSRRILFSRFATKYNNY